MPKELRQLVAEGLRDIPGASVAERAPTMAEWDELNLGLSVSSGGVGCIVAVAFGAFLACLFGRGAIEIWSLSGAGGVALGVIAAVLGLGAMGSLWAFVGSVRERVQRRRSRLSSPWSREKVMVATIEPDAVWAFEEQCEVVQKQIPDWWYVCRIAPGRFIAFSRRVVRQSHSPVRIGRTVEFVCAPGRSIAMVARWNPAAGALDVRKQVPVPIVLTGDFVYPIVFLDLDDVPARLHAELCKP